MIEELIDKQDGFEIVRDQIAAILATEIANQQELAAEAGRDPSLWKLRIYTERSNPWEAYLTTPVVDKSPLVNVWYDNSNFLGKASGTVSRQQTQGIFNIDCYGYGESSDVDGGGHLAGDQEAAFAVQRAIRLVRNILMAGEYTYLGLRGNVGSRWPQSISILQPQIDNRVIQGIIASRIALAVTFNEFSPQVTPETLDLISAQVIRAEDGEIVIEADYDYTT